MATTSIWAVKGWLGKVVLYIENPDKVENPRFYEKQNMSDEQAQGLSDVISYAIQTKKTTGQAHDENTEIKKRFVTGVNCDTDIARTEMMAVKKRYGKTDGVAAYHGYQSFAPGEATPEIAHEIGIKLAEKLWGDRHQVIVATHLDKGNHLHNHFLVNNVSFVDGKKYYRSNKDYYNMQKESDTLCREYGLSVIENPQRGKSKQYAEWQADKQGKPTYRNMVKADVDAAIRESMTERQFFDNLRKKGYEVKQGKDITIRYIGRERGLRLQRNFGDSYSIGRIRERILAQDRPERAIIPAIKPPPKKMRLRGSLTKKRMTGLKALYLYYLYRLGALPKKREPNPKRVYFLFREDIRHIQNISRETRLLVKNNIETDEQLTAYKDGISRQINSAYEERRQLRNKIRRIGNDTDMETTKSEISILTEKLKDLRRELRHCESIAERSDDMREKLRQSRENENNKELVRNDPFRRRR